MRRLEMEIVSEMFRLFINRMDCYAVQTSRGYVRVEEPLTSRVLLQHLQGEKTVGAYQLNPKDNTVKYLCFDLDPEKLDDPRETARRIIQVCFEKPDGEHPRIWGHSLLLEASRYPDPSYHVWIFFLVPFPAKAARWLGYRILELADLDPRKAEVFPKQDELTEDRPFGNFVKLPLGFHRVEKKWSRFLDPESFEPLDPNV
ncbi:MAG: TOTE conflict system archaeo-eukaryotic primase domain-containing protein, partial [Candidatus Freyarchaeota archaeon]